MLAKFYLATISFLVSTPKSSIILTTILMYVDEDDEGRLALLLLVPLFNPRKQADPKKHTDTAKHVYEKFLVS